MPKEHWKPFLVSVLAPDQPCDFPDDSQHLWNQRFVPFAPTVPPSLTLVCDHDIWDVMCPDCGDNVSVICGQTSSDALLYNSTDLLRDYCSGLCCLKQIVKLKKLFHGFGLISEFRNSEKCVFRH